MKTTKRQLKRIVREKLLREMGAPGHTVFSFPLDDETISQQFKKWATEYMGSPAGANSSSVLATFLVDQGYDKDESIVADMSDSLGFDLRDVEMEVKRQKREYDAGGVVSDQESYKRSFKESKVRITKRQLRRIIKEENIRMLVEQAVPPVAGIGEEDIAAVRAAMEEGAKQAKMEYTPTGVMDTMKKFLENAGFMDPCDYVEKKRQVVELELRGMEDAANALRKSDDPVTGLEHMQSAVTGLGAASFVGVLLSGLKTKAALAMNPATYKAAARIAGGEALSGQLAGIPLVGGKIAAAGAGQVAAGEAGMAAASAAAAAEGTVLGITFTTWALVGQIILALGIAIWIYKWLLNSGTACTIKEFGIQVARQLAKPFKWAYDTILRPFVDKFMGWGRELVSKVKGWFTDEKEVTAEIRRMRPSVAKRQLRESYHRHLQERRRMIQQWNRLNKTALTVCLKTRLGC